MQLLLQLDQQGTSSYINSLSASFATSASWAPTLATASFATSASFAATASYASTAGLTGTLLAPPVSVSSSLSLTFVNGVLVSSYEVNVLRLYTTSSITTLVNPIGSIQKQIGPWTQIVGRDCTNMTQFYCYSSPNLTSVNLSGSTSLTEFICSDCPSLTSIDITSLSQIVYLDASNCSLTQTAIDAALTNLVNFGLTGGDAFLQTIGGLGTPSAGGYTSASLLTGSRGWTVVVN